MTNIARAALLALMLATFPAHAQTQVDPPTPFHLALAAGYGTAYGQLGAHLELRLWNVALYGGSGLILKNGPGGAAGLRVFFQPDGRGLFLSLNALGAQGTPENEKFDRFLVLGATFGVRIREKNTFVELGLGPGVSYGRFWTNTGEGGALVPKAGWSFGACGPYQFTKVFCPDLAIALGYEL